MRLAVLLLLLPTMGCGGGPSAEFSAPDSMILYSVDARDYPDGGQPKTIEKLHGFPVVGKVEITDPAERKALMAALRKGHRQRPSSGAKCFIPRHALRLVQDGRTADLVVCFQCMWIYRYEGGERTAEKAISASPKEAFDRALKAANVPVVPEGMVAGPKGKQQYKQKYKKQ